MPGIGIPINKRIHTLAVALAILPFPFIPFPVAGIVHAVPGTIPLGVFALEAVTVTSKHVHALPMELPFGGPTWNKSQARSHDSGLVSRKFHIQTREFGH